MIRIGNVLILCAVAGLLTACAAVSKRMPSELHNMHDVLVKDNPNTCQLYHYNFERQAPRLFQEDQVDSLLDVIDYIKTECGPTATLETSRLLLLCETGRFSDTLVGPVTVAQMLRFRTEKEYSMWWLRHNVLLDYPEPQDNSHERFVEFQSKLAERVVATEQVGPSEESIGLFYSGRFDSSFSRIQADDMRGTKLRESYDELVSRTKMQFPERGHVSIQLGNWNPQGNNRLLGTHPELAVQLGAEWSRWRLDGTINYRFLSSREKFEVDSLGELVTTDKFNSWLFGGEVGYKVIDNARLSTDLFVGLGYEVIYSVTEARDPEEYKTHGSLGLSAGVRQRVFLDRESGWYVGGAARYSRVDYGNPRGTDLSGNTLTVSLITGWSYHATLKQFLKKLNYKGNWR